MDDWDSEPAASVAAPVNQWADEDVGEEEAPDSWDAEPEEPKAKSSSDLVPPEKKKAITKRALAKKEEEERRLAEKMAKAQLDNPNHSAEERERLRRLEEDRDAALAGDLFGSDAVKAKDATSDLPGTERAKQAAAAATSSAGMSADATAVPASAYVESNASLKVGARIEEAVLDTDADVDKFVSELGKRLAQLGKSVLASKKIARLITNLTEETIKLGVLRIDDVGELKRVMTVKHNDMTTKMKKGDKKGKAAPAKPAVTLARNAFMSAGYEDMLADERGAGIADDDFM